MGSNRKTPPPPPPAEPETEPKTAPVTVIHPEFTAKQALSAIMDSEPDFEIDPEILEILKNVA